MNKTQHTPAVTEAAEQGSVRSFEGRTGLFAGASVVAAVASSACCIVPLVLFLLGISGAWIANLTAMAPYKPYFATMAGVLILAGFISMRRRRRRACSANGYCASTLATWVTTVALCASTLLVVTVLLWPYLLPIFMGA